MASHCILYQTLYKPLFSILIMVKVTSSSIAWITDWVSMGTDNGMLNFFK